MSNDNKLFKIKNNDYDYGDVFTHIISALAMASNDELQTFINNQPTNKQQFIRQYFDAIRGFAPITPTNPNSQRTQELLAIRAKKIYEPCPLLGMPLTQISQEQCNKIENLLNTHHENHKNTLIIPPKYSNKYTINLPSEKIKILWYHPYYDENASGMVRYYLDYKSKNNSNIAGFEIYPHLIKRNCFRPNLFATPSEIAQEIEIFDKKCTEIKPDIVTVCYGPADNIEGYFGANIFRKLKEKHGFMFMRQMDDFYTPSAPIPQEWVDVIDKIVVNHDVHPQLSQFIANNQLIFTPNLILDDNMPINTNKKYDFGFSGLIYGNRTEFLSEIPKFITNNNINLHNNTGIKYNYYEEFIDFMGSCAMMFNTGLRNITFNNHELYYIMNTRIVEAIKNKTLIFDEGHKSSASDFFIPYIHYIPVESRAELAIFAQFFVKYPKWREKISEQAFKFYRDNYSEQHIWSEIYKHYCQWRQNSHQPKKLYFNNIQESAQADNKIWQEPIKYKKNIHGIIDYYQAKKHINGTKAHIIYRFFIAPIPKSFKKLIKIILGK